MSKNKELMVGGEGVQVPLHFNLPIDKPSVYATNLILQVSEYEVIISFYEAQPPIIYGENAETNLATLQKAGIRGDCVAKVIVAKQRFQGFAEVINKLADEINKTDK